MAKQRPLRLGLVGSGQQAEGVLAPALARAARARPDQVELACICSPKADFAERLCKQFGFLAACTDPAAMVRDHSIGACVCALPAADTAIEVPQLLANKTPCLLTLPLGEGLSDVLAMAEAARERNTPHAVAMPRRFNPYFTRGLKWAQQLGPIQSVNATLATPGRIDRPLLWCDAVHAMDAMAHVLGRIDKRIASPPGDAADSADARSITLRFAGQTTGRLDLRGQATADEESYEIRGEGFLSVVTLQGHAGPSLVCWRGGRIEVKIHTPQGPAEPTDDGTEAAILDFVAHLQGDGKLAPTLEEVMPVLDIALQMGDSLEPAGAVSPA